jgi:hypothetical protein
MTPTPLPLPADPETGLNEIEQTSSDESTIKGVSIRGIIALVLIASVCALAFLKIAVTEPLYTLASTVVAFYFGHQTALRQNRNK